MKRKFDLDKLNLHYFKRGRERKRVKKKINFSIGELKLPYKEKEIGERKLVGGFTKNEFCCK